MLCPPTCGPGACHSMPAILGSSGTLSLATFLSPVEYPLQLLHSPPAPVVKRPGVAAHHPLQVLPCLLLPGTLSSAEPLSLLALGSLALSTVCPVMGVVLLGCFSFSFFLDRQEPPQPLNLTAKPKVPELPNTSSSPSLKMNSCGPRPASHGAPTRDLQSSPPSLPLGKPFHLLSP